MMEFVEPIRDKKQIDNMKRYLKERNLRDWLLFLLGINNGLRIVSSGIGKFRCTIQHKIRSISIRGCSVLF
ncbi:hypothetical protein MAMMFC1_03196 [Methylomusa anaerophila]|uniref:Uncharacterized protein n=1 Tax=Methylomusa anaerophila TaxID=1930071 RepID=A0A348AN55_9FIRM|nr:hypothetical protein MAMMFC1_03196 [Methylomusa anaerophila]